MRVPEFLDSRHKIVRLPVLRTGRLYLPADISGSGLWGHSGAGRIRSMKGPNDLIVFRTRDLPAFSAVPEPTAPTNTKSTEMLIEDCKWRTYSDVPKFSKLQFEDRITTYTRYADFCDQMWTLQYRLKHVFPLWDVSKGRVAHLGKCLPISTA
jgi:hypothetical protein